MKKLLIILGSLVVVAIILSIFTGCNRGDRNYTQNTTNNQNYSSTPSQNIEDYFAKVKDKEKNIGNLSYSTETIMGENKAQGKFFKKGNKKRIDSTTGDIQTISIVDYDQGKVITYVPSEKRAFSEKIDTTSDCGNFVQYVGTSQEEAANYFLGDKTEKNGYTCQMLLSNDKTSSMCISDEYGIPVFLDSNGTTLNITDISTEPVSDDIFVIPSDVKIVEK